MPLQSSSIPGVGSVMLGRLEPATPPLVPKFARYVSAALPQPPAEVTYSSKLSKTPMYANNRYGCCVFSTCAHHLGVFSAVGNPPQKIFTDEQVLAMYSAVTGFDPSNPRTDNGAMISDALNYLCRPTLGLDGSSTMAYVSVGVGEGTIRAKQAAWLFGGLHLGISMPAAWQSHTGPNGVWDVGSGPAYRPGTWGGHAVPLVDYNSTECRVITWGQLQRVTWRALGRYCDEAYALVDADWVAGTQKLPHGFDLAALIEDWRDLGGSPFDPPTPPSPPDPGPYPPDAGTISLDLTNRKYTFPPGWSQR